MAINRFIVGKYYRWIGEKKRYEHWNNRGAMDFILDGKWRKCKYSKLNESTYCLFENSGSEGWFWYGMEFEESDYPDGQPHFKGL